MLGCTFALPRTFYLGIECVQIDVQHDASRIYGTWWGSAFHASLL